MISWTVCVYFPKIRLGFIYAIRSINRWSFAFREKKERNICMKTCSVLLSVFWLGLESNKQNSNKKIDIKQLYTFLIFDFFFQHVLSLPIEIIKIKAVKRL